ncbi:MAG TPA: thiol reductant ABC exporter subunit CydC [Dehalococcoidia bacterium]|nr:thiol reductant ABC exporter subunit CydC [Dehalococcoidia bacterium]
MNVSVRLLRLLAPYRWRVALTVLLGIFMIACNIGLLGMAAYLISDAALRPLVVALTLPIYIVRFASVGRAASRYGERLAGHSLTLRLLARLRARIFRHLARADPGNTSPRSHSGDLLARLVADVDELQSLYLRVVGPFLVAGVSALLTSGIFALFSLELAWCALAFLALGGLGVPLLSRRLGRAEAALPPARAALHAELVDAVQGVQDILAFGREDDALDRIASRDASLAAVQRRASWAGGLERVLAEAVQGVAVWAVLLLAIPLVTTQRIGGVYLAFLALVMLASFEAVQPLAPALHQLGRTFASGRRVFGTLDLSPVVAEPADPLPLPCVTLVEGPVRTAPAIAFDHVTFRYAPHEMPALADATFAVPAGSRMAVVGPSGAGKSTLARLAVRFRDPEAGTIRLGGADVSRLALGELRGAVAVAEQDAHLFDSTLRGNLRLARPDATDDDMVRALELAQLGDFLRALPDGLETRVGEYGLRLSGGERQRLALARALLKDAPILILDEPTANLDPATEAALLDALHTHLRGRTVLLITHRLVRMERMDEILVLDAGRIVERGTHESLLAASGLYRRLFDVQNDVLRPAAAAGDVSHQ